MRFRFSGEEVRSLYTTGTPGRYPSELISAFFGTLEAIEAAPTMADLEALASLPSGTPADGRVVFGLPAGWRLDARKATEKVGVAVLTIKLMRDVVKEG